MRELNDADRASDGLRVVVPYMLKMGGKNMKKWKKVLAAILCLSCIQAPVTAETGTVQVQAAAVKNGLKKEGTSYFYYVDGRRVTNTWKSVSTTENGKKVTYRYYFGEDGAAYTGKKVNGKTQIALKKISGCYYGFDSYGRMVTGTYLISGVYRTFSKTTGKLTGLVKEKGKYYYYIGSKIVKNSFKQVKTTASTKTYYFGSNGAAYCGKVNAYGDKIPLVKKIGSSYYGFDTTGGMIRGICVINDKFYAFSSSNGRYNKTLTLKLRAASKEGSDAKQLRSLLGKPQKTETMDSCMGDGKDELLYYARFIVSLYKDKSGKETVLGVISR